MHGPRDRATPDDHSAAVGSGETIRIAGSRIQIGDTTPIQWPMRRWVLALSARPGRNSTTDYMGAGVGDIRKPRGGNNTRASARLGCGTGLNCA